MRLEDITVEDALRGLREAVAERGEEYVYSKPEGDTRVVRCAYTHGKEPGCLVGLALTKLGVPFFVLERWDSGEGLIATVGIVGRTIPRDAREVFGIAQRVQDSKQLWGEALGAAEKYARNLSV